MRESAIWMGAGQLLAEDRARANCAWHVRGTTKKSSWLEWSEQGESCRKLGQRDNRVMGFKVAPFIQGYGKT